MFISYLEKIINYKTICERLAQIDSAFVTFSKYDGELKKLTYGNGLIEEYVYKKASARLPLCLLFSLIEMIN